MIAIWICVVLTTAVLHVGEASDNGGYYWCDVEILAAENWCYFTLADGSIEGPPGTFNSAPDDWLALGNVGNSLDYTGMYVFMCVLRV